MGMMGKVLTMNKEYIIRKGALEGTVGRLVIYDALKNEATLQLDSITLVQTYSENLEELD